MQCPNSVLHCTPQKFIGLNKRIQNGNRYKWIITNSTESMHIMKKNSRSSSAGGWSTMRYISESSRIYYVLILTRFGGKLPVDIRGVGKLPFRSFHVDIVILRLR